MASYGGPSGADNYRYESTNQHPDSLYQHYDPLAQLSEYFSQPSDTPEPNIAPLQQHNYSNPRSTPALQHPDPADEHQNSKTPHVRPNFEQEYEAQVSKVDMFADVITARDNVKTCQMELEARRKIIAENPKKLQDAKVEFTMASEDYNRLKIQFSGHQDLWISRNVKISDFVFMSKDSWDTGLSNESLESMVALAKLNTLLLEEYLVLKKLPVRKEQKKAEITSLKHDLDESKSLVPQLEVKIMELKHKAKVAEEEWMAQWNEKEGPQTKGKSRNAIHHLEARIQTLERENRLLKNPDTWAFDVETNGLINENIKPLFDVNQTISKHDRHREKRGIEDRQPNKTQVSTSGNARQSNNAQHYPQMSDSVNARPDKSSQYQGQMSLSSNARLYNEQTSKSNNIQPYDTQITNHNNAQSDKNAKYRQQLSMIGGSKQDESHQHKKHTPSGNGGVDNHRHQQHQRRKSEVTASSFQSGLALADCEWIIEKRPGSAEKKPWFREAYGHNAEFVWTVLKPLSKRYMDILDWHSYTSAHMSASDFADSDFKISFENLFRREIVLWTLGWRSEDWVPHPSLINFLDVEKRGIKLYNLMEREFNRMINMQPFDGTQDMYPEINGVSGASFSRRDNYNN